MRLLSRTRAWPVVPFCLLASAGLGATFRAGPAPALEQVLVVPFVVESQPYPGAAARPDEAEVLRRMGEEATARAERTLLKQRIAARVARVPLAGSGVGAPVLTGTVRLPVSLPPGQTGGRAMFRKGTFATATVALQRDGVVRQQEVRLGWRDVRWVSGARTRRARKLDDVLADALRKAVDHAVKLLRREEKVAGGTERAAVEGATR